MIVGFLAGSAALLVTAATSAQNALGGGDALDANTNPYSGPYNAPTRGADFRARNLLITGDVVGGRSFQDIVGYGAVDQFRGAFDPELQLLGIDVEGTSDSLYNFRRDSAGSDPALIRLGSRYDRVRFGFEANQVAYRRETTVATAGTIAQGGRQNARPYQGTARRIEFDRQTLAQTLSAEAERAAEPQFVGRTVNEDREPVVVSASPLRGIVPLEAADLSDVTRLSTFDLARLRQDQEAGRGLERPGEQFRVSFGELFEAEQLGGEPTERRLDLGVSDDYTELMERIAERYVTRENVDLEVQRGLGEDLDKTMDELRQGLAGQPPAPPTPEPGVVPAADEDPARTPLGRERPGVERDTDEERQPGRAATPEGIGIILRHGERIENLSTEDQSRVNELIAAAEQRLRDGEFFWAERRFERALRFVPGHPLATAGLGHAQLGAGLHLRAGLTLRTLLQRQPEMIDATYGEGLLPNHVALLSSVDEIRGRIDEEPGDADRMSYGFLLAYLGHQMDDRALIEEGLTICQQAAPEDPLIPLLRQVWIEGKTPEK